MLADIKKGINMSFPSVNLGFWMKIERFETFSSFHVIGLLYQDSHVVSVKWLWRHFLRRWHVSAWTKDDVGARFNIRTGLIQILMTVQKLKLHYWKHIRRQGTLTCLASCNLFILEGGKKYLFHLSQPLWNELILVTWTAHGKNIFFANPHLGSWQC